ncbi:MAG: metal ABC transporter permease [Planctomycetota bacterium]
MSIVLFWTLCIAVVTAVACSLCGTLLVVRREAFVSEGLSHAVLPGIVIAFVIFRDRGTPGLIAAAAASGMLMVWLVQLLCRSGRVDQDAALGIVFSSLFSFGVVLSNLELRNVHFHADCIIDGNLAAAPLKAFELGDAYLGPTAFVSMSVILLVLVAFLWVFFQPLKLAAFDSSLANLTGLRPGLLQTFWLTLVSVTAVAAFETAGTVLVVALMVTPAATANLFTHSLGRMFWVSAAIGAACSAAGVLLANWLRISPAGPIAVTLGVCFLASVLVAPRVGFLAQLRLRAKQRRQCLQNLTLQLVSKATSDVGTEAVLIGEIVKQIAAPAAHVEAAVKRCIAQGWVAIESSKATLTPTGRQRLSRFHADGID